MALKHLFPSTRSHSANSIQQDERRYSRADLLAAIQAQIMYIIMRALDETYLDADLNQEMVVTHQVCQIVCLVRLLANRKG